VDDTETANALIQSACSLSHVIVMAQTTSTTYIVKDSITAARGLSRVSSTWRHMSLSLNRAIYNTVL
jgi:hypothetical protein